MGRGRQVFTIPSWGVVILYLWCWCGASGANTDVGPSEEFTVAKGLTLFSPEWMARFAEGDNGCTLARASYTWRRVGFGSNMNSLLNAWVHGLSMKHWGELAVIMSPGMFPLLDCSDESGVDGLSGWDCLFSEIPHLCVFNSTESWQHHLELGGVPDVERKEAEKYSVHRPVHDDISKVDKILEAQGIKYLSATTAMYKYVWSFMTPWLQDAVEEILQRSTVSSIREAPYIGLHIRRGDKVIHEAKLTPTKKYLSASAKFLQDSDKGISVEAIQGIWVASDDSEVVGEVKDLAPQYFPNVPLDRIIWISDGLEGVLPTRGVQTATHRQGLPEFTILLTDLRQLATSDVFVGTFSSNVGRIVTVMREAEGKPRDTAISVDRPDWFPGRRALEG